ncbi:MAG: SDR family oxidoreductase [Acidimicrobiia bacterium]|nr:SDR family oxidoreductase [Acidimicrobiia bacterium]MDH5505345.1 SDR family oxidoreductase [Acidimicrobiia bacterium]
MDLTGKNVLILGGSGALGRRLAAEFHRRGSRVMLAGRSSADLADQARQLGPGVMFATFDLRDDPGGIIDEAYRLFGALDGVVNAAGVVAFGPLEELSDDALNELVEVNLLGPLRVMRAAVQRMDGGFLVNLTGVVAENPVGGMAAYSAVKAGLSAATRALVRELRSKRILVLDARPPHTETGLADRPIEGVAPELPVGLDPDGVAVRVVDAVAAGRRELAAADFTP